MTNDNPSAEREGREADGDGSWRELPRLIAEGFVMGSADIVPGVSGGTMALILGIYSRLIHAIRSFDSLFIRRAVTFRWKSALTGVHWRFLAMLGCGILAAVFFFTRVVPLQRYMFTHPELIYGLFFGLILGSIFILVKAMERFGAVHALLLAVGTALGFWVVTLVPAQTPETPFFLFLSGSVAICAMVLPGISGSYILLILRKYDYILSQIALLGTAETAAGLLALLPFLLGAVAGLALFTRLLSWLLDSWYALTLAVLVGFLIGSLYIIWPYQQREYREFVTVEKTVPFDSKEARRLRNRAEPPPLPEYLRLGAVIDPSPGSEEERKVEIVSVRKKLVRSEPFLPWGRGGEGGTDAPWQGASGMGIGLLMVIALDFVRRGNESSGGGV